MKRCNRIPLPKNNVLSDADKHYNCWPHYQNTAVNIWLHRKTTSRCSDSNGTDNDSVCVCVCFAPRVNRCYGAISICMCVIQGCVVTGVAESLFDFTALPNCRLILITALIQPSHTNIANQHKCFHLPKGCKTTVYIVCTWTPHKHRENSITGYLSNAHRDGSAVSSPALDQLYSLEILCWTKPAVRRIKKRRERQRERKRTLPNRTLFILWLEEF